MRRSRRTLNQRSNVALLNNSSPCVFYSEMLLTYMRGRTVRSRCHIGGWHENKMAGNSLKEGEHEEVDVVGGAAGDAYRRRGPGHSPDHPGGGAGGRERRGRPGFFGDQRGG